jgi:hypothetical protein
VKKIALELISYLVIMFLANAFFMSYEIYALIEDSKDTDSTTEPDKALKV